MKMTTRVAYCNMRHYKSKNILIGIAIILTTLNEAQLPDGVYTAEFSTDSSMFHVSEACDGKDAQLKAEAPEFCVGDTAKVYAKIKEGNRERIQVFEGTVLKRQGGGVRETFTVRKTSNGVGVEKTWPVHSPHVEKVEIVRLGKVRRAKLNYLRGRIGKAAKVKELVK